MPTNVWEPARGFHQGQSNQLLANRPVIVTQSFLCSSALQIRGSPYSLSSAAAEDSPLERRVRLLRYGLHGHSFETPSPFRKARRTVPAAMAAATCFE